MAMISHDCGAIVSAEVDVCPMCERRVRQDTERFNCKSCERALYVSDHFVRQVSSAVRDTLTPYSADWGQLPCPHCGDPEPIVAVPTPRGPLYAVNAWVLLTVFFLLVFGTTTPLAFAAVAAGSIASFVGVYLAFVRRQDKRLIQRRLKQIRAEREA